MRTREPQPHPQTVKNRNHSLRRLHRFFVFLCVPCTTIFQFLVFITTNHQVTSLKTLCKVHYWYPKIAVIILKVFFNL
jgi:hypothetical protein